MFSVVVLLALSRWRFLASVADRAGNNVTSPFMIRLRNVRSSSALLTRSPQIVMRSTHWSYFRMRSRLCWVTRDMFRSSLRILKHVPWLTPITVARSYTDWERLARTNIATFSILGSVRTVWGRPVRTTSSKLSLSCQKRRCHLNTTLRLNVPSP